MKYRSLNEMVDKIVKYDDILKKYGYVNNHKGGKKPWSHRWEKGASNIDVRDSEWTFYGKDDEELMLGVTPESLEQWLKVSENKNF